MALKEGLKRLCDEARTDTITKDYLGNGIQTYTATVDVAAMTSTLQTLQNVTMTGIQVTDILIGFDFRPATSSDVSYSVRIVATNTVQLVSHHDAATTTDPGSATLKVVVLRI
jgi:hypothetical protein